METPRLILVIALTMNINCFLADQPSVLLQSLQRVHKNPNNIESPGNIKGQRHDFYTFNNDETEQKNIKARSDRLQKRATKSNSDCAPSVPDYQSYQVSYPSLNQWRSFGSPLSRLYYVPFYNAPGRIPAYYQAHHYQPQHYRPLYYPAQPFYTNVGIPPDNPQPQINLSDKSHPNQTIIGNRFGEVDHFEGLPIWDRIYKQEPTRTTTFRIPTRDPNASGVPIAPPLIHNPTDPKEYEPSTTQPPRIRTKPPQQRPIEPSRCVWAIISCCSSTGEVSYDCFEQRGCHGRFWDKNPCDSEFAQAAIAQALNYYRG